MSVYTTELRYIVEMYNNLETSQGYTNINNLIDNAIPFIFDFDFPIFDVAYKNTLCRKIIKHFYTREIAFETVGLWKLNLDKKLNEIMPYYNDLYKTTIYEYDVLTDFNLTKETTNKTTNQGTTSNTDNYTNSINMTAEKTTLFSDTPQNGLTDVLSGNYLTNATKDNTTNAGTNTNTGTTQKTNNNTEDTTGKETIKGKTGGMSYPELIANQRAIIINIDMEIIKELEPLFMQIW